MSPLVLPPYSGAVAARVNRWLLRRTVLRVAAQVGGARPLVWTFLPTDTAVTIIDELDPCGVVYWCLTDFAVITPQRAALAESERALLARTDVVFAQYEQLAADLRRQHGNVHVVPFGVDLAAFRTDAARERPAAAQPVIGYVGGLHWHVDLELVARAARLRPGWRFVFVGSEHTNVDALRREPNIELRGMRPHEELVEHILGFDVCIVPYMLSEYTATVVPTKINEYLAVGRPVVSTPMPAVLDFQAEHQVLELANPRAEDFVAAIERALETADDPDAVERRRRVAALSDWSARFAGMNQVIDEAIGPVR